MYALETKGRSLVGNDEEAGRPCTAIDIYNNVTSRFEDEESGGEAVEMAAFAREKKKYV